MVEDVDGEPLLTATGNFAVGHRLRRRGVRHIVASYLEATKVKRPRVSNHAQNVRCPRGATRQAVSESSTARNRAKRRSADIMTLRLVLRATKDCRAVVLIPRRCKFPRPGRHEYLDASRPPDDR